MIDHDEFGRLDHGSFKAFVAAARTLNFTAAAEKAAMTQSGISQHVARLERELGAPLFARVGRKVALTRAGEILLEFVEGQKDATDGLFERVRGEVGALAGKVRYGMPHSCLFTPHFPLLLQARRRGFPGVSLEVRLIPNETILERLLAREIDFGFVTKRSVNPAIRSELFAREEYVLVGRDRERLRSLDADELLAQPFVSYPGMGILFDLWARHYLRRSALAFERLKIAGTIDGLHGAITMLEHGVGLSVVPRHCVASQLDSGKLFECARLKKGPLLNEIHIVTLAGLEQPRRVRAVLDAFWAMKAAKG